MRQIKLAGSDLLQVPFVNQAHQQLLRDFFLVGNAPQAPEHGRHHHSARLGEPFEGADAARLLGQAQALLAFHALGDIDAFDQDARDHALVILDGLVDEIDLALARLPIRRLQIHFDLAPLVRFARAVDLVEQFDEALCLDFRQGRFDSLAQ